MKKDELKIIRDYVDEKEFVSLEDFKMAFFKLLPDKKQYYFNFYLFDLYKNNILYKYSSQKLKPCKSRKEFVLKLDVDNGLKKQLEKITPNIIISMWNTNDLLDFTTLQMFNSITIVETYSYAKENVMNVLLEEDKYAFYEEDYFVMSKYNNKSKMYIVRSLYDECPILRKTSSGKYFNEGSPSLVTVPKIEKILVDFIVDETYQVIYGDEMNNIYYQILSKYRINVSTLLRYAKKRHSEDKVLKYLKSINFDVESGEFR